jgi:hypothetical protein
MKPGSGPGVILPIGWGTDHEVPFQTSQLLASSAMQKLAEGHDTAPKLLLPSMSTGAEREVPFQEIALPRTFTAMQKLAETHERAWAPPEVEPGTTW